MEKRNRVKAAPEIKMLGVPKPIAKQALRLLDVFEPKWQIIAFVYLYRLRRQFACFGVKHSFFGVLECLSTRFFCKMLRPEPFHDLQNCLVNYPGDRLLSVNRPNVALPKRAV